MVDICDEVFELILVLVCAWAWEGFSELVEIDDVLIADLKKLGGLLFLWLFYLDLCLNLVFSGSWSFFYFKGRVFPFFRSHKEGQFLDFIGAGH